MTSKHRALPVAATVWFSHGATAPPRGVRSTDVLAFAQREGEAQHDATLLGDVVISIPTAMRQAEKRRHSLEREVTELMVHGILHLLGYDHERSPAEARRMYARTREALRALAPSP